jgi:3-(3-hydroxy-phenyl)propionate hydroxylase
METQTARWLIGADGARSETRSALGIEFEGFTWPERFLVVSTPFDFYGVVKDLVSVNYVADPQRWHFLLQIPVSGGSCSRSRRTRAMRSRFHPDLHNR